MKMPDVLLRIRRHFCDGCGKTGTVVSQADTVTILCPRCGGIARPSGGDDAS